MIQQALQKIVNGMDLSSEEMTDIISLFMNGASTDAQIAAFLTAMRIKGETPDELAAAARTMKKNALSIPVSHRDFLVDIVGTGGDRSNTFNISTGAAFVASAAGLRVAKHGNRAVSSRCGSADVIEALGIPVDISPEHAGRCIDEAGIGFLFAQKLHPAMKHVAGARKQIGFRTMFNILGPLTNPAEADVQVVGVYAPELTVTVAEVMRKLGKKRAMVVHGTEGLDEISITADTRVAEIVDDEIRSYTVSPSSFKFPRYTLDDIQGGDPAENATLLVSIFEGKPGAPRDAVCINAAAAIMAAGLVDDLVSGFDAACEAIDSGKAFDKLNRLRLCARSS